MKRAHYSKRMLRKQDYVKFRGRIAWQFFENNFDDFSDVVRVKRTQDFVQPLVEFPISNISYWLTNFCTYFGNKTHRLQVWNRTWIALAIEIRSWVKISFFPFSL